MRCHKSSRYRRELLSRRSQLLFFLLSFHLFLILALVYYSPLYPSYVYSSRVRTYSGRGSLAVARLKRNERWRRRTTKSSPKDVAAINVGDVARRCDNRKQTNHTANKCEPKLYPRAQKMALHYGTQQQCIRSTLARLVCFTRSLAHSRSFVCWLTGSLTILPGK